ncbi:hypothetical protein KUTeg_009773 [Tegillarca granosa]|uniref:Phosphatidylethanolamine-binding protein n=1 Tax=Tegillarca granosa TaxID=220873 RepID=A0ABQ9F7Z2_TEGGR|nr:hypothetical protein KUTeg_009773 [Tegillarca granosa]
MVLDKNAFWFGNNYTQDCPYGPFSLECTNDSPNEPANLITRIFKDMTIDTSKIDRFLTVKYTTEADKTYEGCGQTWQTGPSRIIDVDPLSSDTIYHPLDTKLQPEMTWDRTPGELYTIIIYDAGSHIAHAIHINYNETEVIKPYSGPLNPTSRANVYAFLLFKQKSFINLTEEWRAKLANPMVSTSYNISDAITELQLEGPIAVNVIRVTADLYSVQTFINRHILNNCAYFVSEALKSHNRSFIPYGVSLSVMMYIKFTSLPIQFDSCCKKYNFPQDDNVNLNPIGNGRLKTYQARTGSPVSVQLVKRTIYPMATNFNGALHTLIAVDPDVPSSSAGTQDKPLLHWFVANIPDGVVSNGTEIKSYIGPAPPDKNDHTYYFLLYEQKSQLSENITEMYAGNDCSGSLSGRCLFDVSRMVSDNNLKLVGASWFKATNDEYVRHNHANRNRDNIATICKGVAGYTPNCVVGHGERIVLSFSVLVLSIFSKLFIV